MSEEPLLNIAIPDIVRPNRAGRYYVDRRLTGLLNDPHTPALLHDIIIEVRPDAVLVHPLAEKGRAVIGRVRVVRNPEAFGRAQQAAFTLEQPAEIVGCQIVGAATLLHVVAPPYPSAPPLPFWQEVTNLARRARCIAAHWLGMRLEARAPDAQAYVDDIGWNGGIAVIPDAPECATAPGKPSSASEGVGE